MLKIGHRGAKGYCPENTIESFQKALDLGCDGIELDVHLSKDNVLVVIHDDTIDRTTTGLGFVCNFTSSKLLKLGIPTLEKVVKLVNKKAIINIEIKDEKGIFKVLEFLKKHNSNLHLFQVSSFNWSVLETISQYNPNIFLGVLTENSIEEAVSFAKKINAHSINPYFKLLTIEKVPLIQENGLKIYPWTVNQLEDIIFVKSLNVDGIISDFPDRI